MKVPRNPYIWNKVSTELFYGRRALASQLLQGMTSGTSFGIVGGRRLGKSTLLTKVMEDIRSRFQTWRQGGLTVAPIYVDGLELPFQIAPSDIFRLAAHKLDSYLLSCNALAEAAYQDEKWDETDYLRAFCEHVLAIAERVEYRLQVVVLFDEIEPVLRYDWGQHVFFNWRKVLDNSPVSPFVSAVFAGSTEMRAIAEDIGSPLAGVLTWKELELFSLEDTSRLVNEPTGYQLDLDLTKEVFKLTGGHPCLIQYLMHHVCNRDPGAANRSLAEAQKLFLREQAGIFDAWWSKLESPAPCIYRFLAQSRNPVSRGRLVARFGDTANRALRVLCHVGIVRHHPDTQEFQAAGLLFERWLDEQHSVPVVASLNACPPLAELATLEESETLEFKSSLQWDTKHAEKREYLRDGVLKTIAAFLNTRGGTLVIGVDDNGRVLGLAQDLRILGDSQDQFEQLLMNLICDRIGAQYASLVRLRFKQTEGQTVCVVGVDRASQPAFVQKRKDKEFYVRAGNTTRSLDHAETVEYVRMHWQQTE